MNNNIPKKNKGKPNLSKKIREDLIEADIPDPLPVNFEEQLSINEQDESTTENEGNVDENGDEENCQNEFDKQDDEDFDQDAEDDREKELRNHDLVANIFGIKIPKAHFLLLYDKIKNEIEVRTLCKDEWCNDEDAGGLKFLREIFHSRNIEQWRSLVETNDKDHLQILKDMKLNEEMTKEFKKNKGIKCFSHKLIILPDGTPFSFKLFLPDGRGLNRESASSFTKIDEANWEKAFEAVWEDEKKTKDFLEDSLLGRALGEKLNSVDKKCFDDALKEKDEDPNKVLVKLVRRFRNKFKKKGVRFKDLDKRFREIYKSQIPSGSESNITVLKLIDYIVKNNSFNQDEIDRLEKRYKKRFEKLKLDTYDFYQRHGFQYSVCKEIFKQVKPKLEKPETKVAFMNKSDRKKHLEDQQ